MAETFRYSIPARETRYNGTTFRSELKASWAAFFDCRGIGLWEYEPAVPFQTWRPDFAIPLQNDDYVFAEVKPYTSKSQWLTDVSTLSTITQAREPVVLLGSSPIFPSCFMFKIPEVDAPECEPIDFGPIEDVARDWKEARNIVRCREAGSAWKQ